MIETAVVVPHPPVLVPELAGAAAGETAELRATCVAAVRALAATSRRWVAVGSGPSAPAASVHGDDTCGTFAGFGADVRVALGPGAASRRPDPGLPLPVLVAGWLRAAVGDEDVRVTAHVLPADTDPATCRERGAAIAARRGAAADDGADGATGLLVLGDGAATHTARAPGTFDARAAPWDAAVAGALATGDADTLAGLEPALADALLAGGRVPWQVLAGALPRPGRARLLHSSAPFGVAYHVAVWER